MTATTTCPTSMRVGIHMGSAEDGAATARLMETMNELMGQLLNIMRLGIVMGPFIMNAAWIHTVPFATWLMRLSAIGAIVGGICFFVFPEQLYTGMGLRASKWLFEKFHPDVKNWNGTPLDVAEENPALLHRVPNVANLSGSIVRARLHGTKNFLCINKSGWATIGGRNSAVTLMLEQVSVVNGKVPDTYTLRVIDPLDDSSASWLSFQCFNHLRTGGWLRVFEDRDSASPYKIVRDSSCPPGACKLLCAWPTAPPPTRHYCTGFYVSEQLSGGERYVGHGPDAGAAILEFIVEEMCEATKCASSSGSCAEPVGPLRRRI